MAQLTLSEQWVDNTTIGHNPFVSQAFLYALEQSGACQTKTGWQPIHLCSSERLFIPAYLKNHSWGEYVFDWSWARAYEQYGLEYYPKILVAAPYTPSKGPRLLGARSQSDAQHAVDILREATRHHDASGFHILFPNDDEQQWLNALDLLKRTDVQFHWHNDGYCDFDDFLSTFTSRKRKNIRKERLSIAEQGIQTSMIEGPDITDQQLTEFYQFYHATYLKRGRHGYLNQQFFEQLRMNMPQQMVLCMAYKDEHAIAAALFFKDTDTLYGRYWGSFRDYNNLHFEACYYQGIEYCIRHNLKKFDPGTQGEHKIARGFAPVYTHSYHWLANMDFFEAVKRFCDEEASMMHSYYQQALAALPFKRENT